MSCTEKSDARKSLSATGDMSASSASVPEPLKITASQAETGPVTRTVKVLDDAARNEPAQSSAKKPRGRGRGRTKAKVGQSSGLACFSI